VQESGHLVLERFNSFGKSNYKRSSSYEESKYDPEKSTIDPNEVMSYLIKELVGSSDELSNS